jgi:serine/threonine protein kinase
MGAGISATALAARIHEKYSLEYQIGTGAFSDVYLSIDKTDQSKVAIKRVNILSALSLTRGIEALSNEVKVFKRIGCHENIVSLHCAYRHKNHYYFVMDGLLGGDLRKYLRLNGKISQRAISYITACIGSGLNHMHRRGVIHRDIKPENIVFDSKGIPYLTDFGISHIASNNSFVCEESSGTLPYLAPEVLTRTHKHAYHSDFWSLGITVYELLFGKRPFYPHVPMEFVNFAAYHYHNLWDNLPATTSPTALTAENPLPQQSLHNDKVTLIEDGKASVSLITPVPSTRSSIGCPEKVGQDLIDLVTGLLDVRIPERLGSMNRFEDFAFHSALIHFGCLRTYPSPLVVEDRRNALSGEVHKSFEPTPVDDLLQQFNPLIESELKKIFYVRPAAPRDDPLSSHSSIPQFVEHLTRHRSS